MDKICDYGCGALANFFFKNGKNCCSKQYRQCPRQRAIVGSKRQGTRHSEDAKRRIGEKSKGRVSWCTGLGKSDPRIAAIADKLTGITRTEETKQRIKETKKLKPSWNKGLTADEDSRIFVPSGSRNGMYGRTHSDETKLKLKSAVEGKWVGEKNPWYGKSRSRELSPKWMGEAHRRKYKDYSNRVHFLSKQSYEDHKDKINPQGHLRVKAGVEGYHLDHIFPVAYGYKLNIPPEVLADWRNLQMLYWRDNIMKGTVLLEEAITAIKNIAPYYGVTINWNLLD